MNAPLSKKLNEVKWGEFKIGDLFEIQKISNMLSKEDLSDDYIYPAYSSDSENNGIIGYTNSPEFICDEKHPVYITFGDHTRTLNIARKSFSVLDNVKVLLPCTNKNNSLLFMISVWKKQIPNLGYARHWKVAKNCILSLPITPKNKIDFDFMEAFIRELEEERIRELEEERIRELAAYLKVSGFDNYELSKCESEALAHFNSLKWKEFNLIDIFDVNGEYYVSEVNPRFGGGYPHAYESGADHMKFIVNNLEGNANKCVVGENYEIGTYMMKYIEVLVKKL